MNLVASVASQKVRFRGRIASKKDAISFHTHEKKSKNKKRDEKAV